MRYSWKDGWLCLAAALQLAATIAWAGRFDRLGWAANAGALAAMLLVFYFNPIVVTHNFLHCPFFRWEWLNRLFAVANSVNLGLPQILYKYHHLTHHKYNNDPVRDGTTKDPSSTFRYGKRGRQEHFVPYCALGLFRDGTTSAFLEVKRKRELPQFFAELAASAAALVFWATFGWRWLVFGYLPLFYFGWFLAHLENYYEHFNATDAGARFANSVSYYGPLYNVFMFNEGYHQEHHVNPQTHWTGRPAIRERYRAELRGARAHAAKVPPLLGFLD
ncbi:MAG: fatty acid desaturase [Deltaproteobacteria bacterium]|nr:fatty acid desaturase [Deltaproteobacteria bacterium]